MSQKRQLNDVEASPNEPPIKKQNVNTNVVEIKSIWSSKSPNDHAQFKQLFTTIDNSELCQLLKIPYVVNKEIAEYSLIICNNSKCNNKIPNILYQDAETYNHKNAKKLGYKWCGKSNTYYCNMCMDLTDSCKRDFCNCGKLYFIPDSDKCDYCEEFLCNINCECGCEYCSRYDCLNCGAKFCHDCYSNSAVSECVECWGSFFCSDCSVRPYGMWTGCDLGYCVCNDCYDDTLIECNKCNYKYPLYYKTNPGLYDDNDNLAMTLCKFYNYDGDSCDAYVCLECYEKERNGNKVLCGKQGCNVELGYWCNLHSFCYAHCSKC